MNIPTTPPQLYAWLGSRIAIRCPKTLRAPLNRTPAPKGEYAIFQPIGDARRVHRPVAVVLPTGLINEYQDMVQDVQVDFFGDNSDANSRAFILDILSPTEAPLWKAAGFGVVPPDGPAQFRPFINDENQYEERWILRFGILYTQVAARDVPIFDHIDVGLPGIGDGNADPTPPAP